MLQHFLKFPVWCSLVLFFSLFISCDQNGDASSDPSLWSPSKSLIEKEPRELNISEKGIKSVSDKIAALSKLEKLNLQANELEDLPSSMSKLSNVRKLNLAKNKFTKLPEVVIQMTGLKELDLRHNKITELPESIQNMKSLHTIYIKGTDLDKEDRKLLRQWLPKVKVIGR